MHAHSQYLVRAGAWSGARSVSKWRGKAVPWTHRADAQWSPNRAGSRAAPSQDIYAIHWQRDGRPRRGWGGYRGGVLVARGQHPQNRPFSLRRELFFWANFEGFARKNAGKPVAGN